MRAVMQKVAASVTRMENLGYKFTFNLSTSPKQSKDLDLSSRAAGHVWPKGKTMELVISGHGSGRPFGATFEVVAHELLHSVTIPLIRYGQKNPNTVEGKTVQELLNLRDFVRKEVLSRKRKGIATAFEESILRGGNVFGSTTSTGKFYHKEDETISWGMTSAQYREVLESIPYKGKTALDAFVTMIRNLIGISAKNETALSELIRLTHEVLNTELPVASEITDAIPVGMEGIESTLNNVGPEIPTASMPTPATTAPAGSLIGKPRAGYTKLNVAPSFGKSIINTVKKIQAAWNGDTWTKFRIAAVDPSSGLMKTLSGQELWQNGQLRADMLNRAFSQVINLIKNGLQTGVPVLNSDGSVIIQSQENNLARSQAIADSLDNNSTVVSTGKSGRQFIADIARILRGEEIMQVDAGRREKAKQKMLIAKQKMAAAKQAKIDGKPLTEIIKLVNEAKAIRKTYSKDVNVNREKQVTAGDIQWAKENLDAVPEAQKILDIWRDVNLSLVDLWEKTGLLSTAQADYYRGMKHYVPLYAAREDLEATEQETYTGKRTGTKSVRLLDHLEGADIQRNIWENLDKHYASMTAGAFQNQTRRIAVQQLMSGGLHAAKFAKNGDDPKVNLRFKDPEHPDADANGVVHVILDNPNDLAAFQMMHHELGPIMKGFAVTTQVLRAGALINPMYWIKQLIRDPIHASVVANTGMVTPMHATKEFITILMGKSKEAKLLAERGVIGQVDSTQDLYTFLKNVGTEKAAPSRIGAAMHKVMQIHEASDAASRVAIFKVAKKQALKDGMSEADAINFAVHKSRESANFAVRGNSSTLNTLRNMIPFFSASITSLDTVYRAATGYGLNPQEKKEAQILFAKRAAMMATLSLVYAMFMQDDEDYKKLPDNVKDDNWLLPSPIGSQHSFLKVAVPFEVGFLFKTLPEGFVRYMADTSSGKEVLASYMTGIKKNLPGEGIMIPQAVRPALEVITNHSFLTGRGIEGMSDQGLPTAERGPHASEAAKTLSNFGLSKIGLSPAMIDHLIQGYSAQAGTFFANAASDVVNVAQGKVPPSKNIEDAAFFKSFLTNPNTSKAATDYYELSANAREAANFVNRAKKQGRIEDVKEFLADPENKKLIAAEPTLRKIQDQMSKIRNQMEYIRNQKGDPEVRREKINQLQESYDRMARNGKVVADKLGIKQ